MRHPISGVGIDLPNQVHGIDRVEAIVAHTDTPEEWDEPLVLNGRVERTPGLPYDGRASRRGGMHGDVA